MAKTDFDKDKLAEDTEQHGKDISGLVERVGVLEEKFKPEQLAIILEEASKDSKKIDVLFSKIFCYMMNKDEDVKKAISEHIKTSDRSVVFSTLKKWGGFVTGALIYIRSLHSSFDKSLYQIRFFLFIVFATLFFVILY